jgi:5-methyltetrahydropteroyltriglutamate--homocysteine methyltransferase
MTVVAGVIDSTTNVVEHPEVVADRITNVAEALGSPDRVIASTDCGMSTYAGWTVIAEDVVWAKLSTLTEGAQLATNRLY